MQKRPPSQYASPAKQAKAGAVIAAEVTAAVAETKADAPERRALRRATRSMAHQTRESGAHEEEDIEQQSESAEPSSGDVSPHAQGRDNAAGDDGGAEAAAPAEAAAEAPCARGGNIVRGATSFIQPAKPAVKEKRPAPAVKALQIAEKQRQAEEKRAYVLSVHVAWQDQLARSILCPAVDVFAVSDAFA